MQGTDGASFDISGYVLHFDAIVAFVYFYEGSVIQFWWYADSGTFASSHHLWIACLLYLRSVWLFLGPGVGGQAIC